MKKHTKKFLTPILSISVFAIASVALGAGMLLANADDTDEKQPPYFDVTAASVRYVEDKYDAGIRFQLLMDKDSYDAVQTAGGAIGAKMIPAYYLGGDNISTSTSEKIVKVQPKEWKAYTEDTTKMEGIVYVYNIPAANFGTDLVIAGYATAGAGDVTSTDAKTFTLAQVAQATVEADASATESLKSYYTFTVSYDGGATTQEVTYGEKLTPSEANDGCASYTNSDGSATWDFVNMTVTGNVVLKPGTAAVSHTLGEFPTAEAIANGGTATARCSVCGKLISGDVQDKVINYSLSGDDAAYNASSAKVDASGADDIYVNGTSVGTTLNLEQCTAANDMVISVLKGDEVTFYRANVWTNVIDTTDEFFAMNDNLAGTYVLGRSLDFTGIVVNGVNSAENKMHSIGWKANTDGALTKMNAFTGVFDGNGYALKNVTLNGYNATSGIGASLFMYTKGATVKNVMADVTLGSVGKDSVKCTGLVGEATDTTVADCFVIFRSNQSGYGSNYVSPLVYNLTGNSLLQNCVGVIDAT